MQTHRRASFDIEGISPRPQSDKTMHERIKKEEPSLCGSIPLSASSSLSEEDMSIAQEELKAVPQQFLERCSVPDESADILVGAYLLDHMRTHCEQCGISDTPQWCAPMPNRPLTANFLTSSSRRKGWDSPLTNKPVPLCNACGLKFAKKQSCPFCNYIYRREEEKARLHEWVGCALCPRYVHIACEARSNTPAPTKSLVYLCPECRVLQPQLVNLGLSAGPAFAS